MQFPCSKPRDDAHLGFQTFTINNGVNKSVLLCLLLRHLLEFYFMRIVCVCVYIYFFLSFAVFAIMTNQFCTNWIKLRTAKQTNKNLPRILAFDKGQSLFIIQRSEVRMWQFQGEVGLCLWSSVNSFSRQRAMSMSTGGVVPDPLCQGFLKKRKDKMVWL